MAGGTDAIGRARTIADIERLLRQGLLGLDAIAERVAWSPGEVEEEEQLGMDGARALVRACWERLAPSLVRPSPSLWARLMSRAGEEPTPLERLQGAFDGMDRNGILARLYPTTERQPALDEVDDELEVARSRGRTYEGYCVCDERSFFGEEYSWVPNADTLFFYGPRLPPLTFFDELTAGNKTAEAVLSSLEEAGFDVAWNGSPGTAIAIVGVAWSGWRGADGAPLARTGRSFPDEAVVRQPRPRRGTPVFVSAGLGRPDAHRLLSAISRHAGVAMYGDLERFGSTPAAVAVRIDETASLDLIGGPAPDHPGLSVLQRKANVRRCRWLVATDTAYPWDEFAPARRIFVAAGGAPSPPERDTWRIVPVNLGTGEGVDQLLRVLEEAARSED